MIEVELPDGSVVEFPDDTTEETMNAALKNYTSANPPLSDEPAPETDWWSGRAAGIRGGFNEIVATGADFLATPGRKIAEFSGIDPDQARIEFAGIPLTDIAEDQRGAAEMERGIQQANSPEGGLAGFGTELVDSFINMAPSVVTARLTKKGDLGLGVMAGQVFSTELTKGLNEGLDKEQAAKNAVIATVAEIGPEKAFGFFDDLPFTKGVKMWLRQIVQESISESATETINIMDERYRQGKDIGDFWDTLLRTGKAGAAGAVMGGGFAAPGLLARDAPVSEPTDPVQAMIEEADRKWQERIANEGREPIDLREELHQRIDQGRAANEERTYPDIPSPVVVDPAQTMAGAGPIPAPVAPEPAPVAPEPAPEVVPEPTPEPQQEQPAVVDAWRASDEERQEHQRRVREGEVEKNKDYVHRAYRKGRMFEAVELEDGTWLVRRKVNHRAQWSEWLPQDSVDTAGLTPLSRPTGKMLIKGQGKLTIGEAAEKDTGPKGPPTLVEDIVHWGKKLNRQAFISQFGIDPADTKGVRPVEGKLDGLWTDEGGMTPEELLEFVLENKYAYDLGLEGEGARQLDLNDAYDLLARSLAGERIVSLENDVAEAEYQAELRAMDEEAINEANEWTVEDPIPEGNEQDTLEALRLLDQEIDAAMTDEQLDALAEEYYRSQEDAVIEPTEAVSQGTEGQEAQLIPEPTAQEQNRAAEEAKTAERNGLGRDEVLPEQGEGELLAGNEPGQRPVQTTIVTEDQANAARERLKAKLGTLRSGIDPEMLADLGILAAHHIEKGARTFAAFSKAMVNDLGEKVRPYLARLWNENKPEGAEEAKEPPQQPPVAQESDEGPWKPRGATSTKNAAAANERGQRGEDPILAQARQANPDLIAKAEDAYADNPNIGEETVERLNNDPEPSISVLDEAVLFIYKIKLRKQIRTQAERMLDENASDEARAIATAKYEDLITQQNKVDLATHNSGAVWGRLGQLRSRMMQEDYTFEAQVAATAAVLGRPPSKEQLAVIKEMADRIADLEKQLEKANDEAQKRIDDAGVQTTMEALAREFDQQQKSKRTVKQKLKSAREAEIEWLKKNQGRLNALPVDMVYHLAKLGSIIIAEGAVNVATFAKKLRKALGDKFYSKIESDLDEIYALSQDQYQQDKEEYAEQTIEDVKIEAEALSEASEPLTHRLVYNLARAYVQSGIRGENEVMAAVHRDLQEFFPDLTERDVRRLFSEYGKAKYPSQDEDKKRLRELRALVRIQMSIDRLKEGLDPLRTGPQRDKQTQEIREKQRALNVLMRRRARANPIPSRDKLATVDEQRIRRLENQIADLEREIATGVKPEKRGEPIPDSPRVTKLKAKRDALKKHLQEIEEAKKPVLSPEEKYNEMRGKQLRRELREVQERLARGDYGIRKRKEPPPLSEQNKKLHQELMEAKMELAHKRMEWERSEYNWVEKRWDDLKQFTSLTRAIITSYDLSAVLRQGGFFMLSNPQVAIKSFIPMLKALRNDANARAVNEEILSRPNADLYRKAGLFLAEQDSAHPTKMEEVYMGRWQKRVPGVPMSGRAYVTFLNKLRADAFDAAVERFGRAGKILTLEEAKDLAQFINNATGRADLGKLNSEGMSTVFFAPRWVASRFNMAFVYPLKMMGMPSRKGKRLDKQMRKYMRGQYAKYLMGYSILWGLTALAFGEDDDDDYPVITWDPTSSDFGKVRVGNTRMDTTSGLSNAIVFVMRVLSGHTTNQKGESRDIRVNGDNIPFGSDNAGDFIWRFFRSKLAPIPASTINVWTGENVVGENYSAGAEWMRENLGLPEYFTDSVAGNALQEALGFAVPLSVKDFYEALEEHGLAKTAALQVLATLGISMNTYDPESRKPKKKGRPERETRSRSSRPKRPERA